MGVRTLFCCLAFLLLLPNFINFSFERDPEYNNEELYDPELGYITSISSLLAHTDSVASKKQIKQGTAEYGLVVANTIRRRFYHGFSVFNFNENWMAVVAQMYFGKNLANPVEPEDILQFPFAGCSQQAIVLMKAMKEKQVAYRSIGFPHHYATELKFDNTWYFFDTDMEPDMRLVDRKEKNWGQSPDKLKKYYKSSMAELNWGLGNDETLMIGSVNANPAPNATLFQHVTNVLSKTLWLLPLMLAFSIRIRKAKGYQLA